MIEHIILGVLVIDFLYRVLRYGAYEMESLKRWWKQ